jgi:hypothetical protein
LPANQRQVVKVVATDSASGVAPEVITTIDKYGYWNATGINVAALQNGDITFTATGQIETTNTATNPPTVTRQDFTGATGTIKSTKIATSAAPEIQILQTGRGYTGSAYISGGSLPVRVKQTDAPAQIRVDLSDSSGHTQTVTTADEVATGQQLNVLVPLGEGATGIQDGVITATATSVDADGDPLGLSAASQAFLDRVNPTATIGDVKAVYVSSPIQKDTIFNGTAADDRSVDLVRVQVLNGPAIVGDIFARTNSNGASTTWVADFTGYTFMPGQYTLSAVSYDAARNASAAPPVTKAITIL